MTTAQRIILRNADNGIVFYRDADALKWEPPVAMTPGQLACLDRYKADLLALCDAEVCELLELPCARVGKKEILASDSSSSELCSRVLEGCTR